MQQKGNLMHTNKIETSVDYWIKKLILNNLEVLCSHNLASLEDLGFGISSFDWVKVSHIEKVAITARWGAMYIGMSKFTCTNV